MVKTVLRRLGLALLAAVGETRQPAAGPSDTGQRFRAGAPSAGEDRSAAAASGPASGETFEREAARMLKTGAGTMHAGAVLLIGMDDIRSTLGPAWRRVADRAQGVAEEAIRRHLGRHDVFTRRDDETYFLCFANLDREQAKALAQRIVDDIKGTLVRQLPDVHAIDVGHEMVELSAGALKDGAGGLAEPIGAAIDRIRKDAGARRQQERRRVLGQAVVRYAPVWSVVKASVVFFRCLPEDVGGGPLLPRLQALSEGGDGPEATAEVDGVALERATVDLHALVQERAKVMLIVPVGFVTLARKKSREAYLALCNRLPEEHRRFVMFELYGIPPRIRGDRLVELVLTLKPYSRAIILEKPPDGLPEDVLMAKRAFAVSIDLDSSVEGDDLRRLLATCARAKLGALLYGVRTRSGVASAAKAGFHFVGGDAIGRPLDKPRAAYALDPRAERQTAAA